MTRSNLACDPGSALSTLSLFHLVQVAEIHNRDKVEIRVLRRGRKPTPLTRTTFGALTGFSIHSFNLLALEHNNSACELQVFASTGVRKHALNSGTDDTRPLSLDYPMMKGVGVHRELKRRDTPRSPHRIKPGESTRRGTEWFAAGEPASVQSASVDSQTVAGNRFRGEMPRSSDRGSLLDCLTDSIEYRVT